MTTRRVGIVVFPDVEVLDAAGPYEVFSVAGRRHGLEPFEVLLVSADGRPVEGRNRFVFTPHVSYASAPPLDILLVPGGFGTRRLMHDAETLAWVAERAATAEVVMSVCTGALVLGRAGLLDGLEATTHASALGLLREAVPDARVLDGVRLTDNGKVVTSAGVSAGIDLSLHLVARLLGAELAEEAAGYMEYDWRKADGRQDGKADGGAAPGA